MKCQLGVHISPHGLRAYYFIVKTDDDGSQQVTWLGDVPPQYKKEQTKEHHTKEALPASPAKVSS